MQKAQEVQNWFQNAPSDDAITGAVAGLKRIAALPLEHRQRFVEEVTNDQATSRLFEDLKTTA